MSTDYSDTKEMLESVILSSQVPSKQFEFSNADFQLEIISAALIIDPAKNWEQLIPQMEIWVHIIGYSMQQNDVIPAIKCSTPLHLFNNPYNKNPIFQLNKLIDKQVFSSNSNLADVNRFVVKIELKELKRINEKYTLQLEIIK